MLNDLQKLLEEKKAKHDAEYPMCARLAGIRSDKAIILCFLDWLRAEKQIHLTRGPDFITESDNAFIMEYFGVDQKQLEKERRKILAAQRKAIGDFAEEDE